MRPISPPIHLTLPKTAPGKTQESASPLAQAQARQVPSTRSEVTAEPNLKASSIPGSLRKPLWSVQPSSDTKLDASAALALARGQERKMKEAAARSPLPVAAPPAMATIRGDNRAATTDQFIDAECQQVKPSSKKFRQEMEVKLGPPMNPVEQQQAERVKRIEKQEARRQEMEKQMEREGNQATDQAQPAASGARPAPPGAVPPPPPPPPSPLTAAPRVWDKVRSATPAPEAKGSKLQAKLADEGAQGKYNDMLGDLKRLFSR